MILPLKKNHNKIKAWKGIGRRYIIHTFGIEKDRKNAVASVQMKHESKIQRIMFLPQMQENMNATRKETGTA